LKKTYSPTKKKREPPCKVTPGKDEHPLINRATFSGTECSYVIIHLNQVKI